jgi:hypothetical protein
MLLFLFTHAIFTDSFACARPFIHGEKHARLKWQPTNQPFTSISKLNAVNYFFLATFGAGATGAIISAMKSAILSSAFLAWFDTHI